MPDELKKNLIALFVKRGHKGKEIVEEVKDVLSLIDSERCEWTFIDADTIKTECGEELIFSLDDLYEMKKPSHCWNCGKRIEVVEVKDGQG